MSFHYRVSTDRGVSLSSFASRPPPAPVVHHPSSSSSSAASRAAALHALDHYDYLCKLLVIGDSGAGKSSLLKRFADNDFSTGYSSTIGVDFEVRTVDVQNKRIKLQMWDTAGQERFRTITTSYYRGASAVLIVFDVTSEESFGNIHRWLAELHAVTAGAVGSGGAHSPHLLLVANKCDLTRQRVVEAHRIEELAASLGVPYLETSAKTNVGVSDAFHSIAATFLRERLRHDAAGNASAKGEAHKQIKGVRLDDQQDGRSVWSRCGGACAIM